MINIPIGKHVTFDSIGFYQEKSASAVLIAYASLSAMMGETKKVNTYAIPQNSFHVKCLILIDGVGPILTFVLLFQRQ